jgi:hypothetical protein
MICIFILFCCFLIVAFVICLRNQSLRNHFFFPFFLSSFSFCCRIPSLNFIIFRVRILKCTLTQETRLLEGRTFGSEFMAMKTVAKVNKGIRYKLRMMGIPIDGPSYVYGDNMSALHKTSNPESTLKKSNPIAYHLVRDSIAMDEMRTGYVNTNENYSDLMTKSLLRGERRESLLRGAMWKIYSKSKSV